MKYKVEVRCKLSELDSIKSKINLHDDDVVDIVVTDTGIQWNQYTKEYDQVRDVSQ